MNKGFTLVELLASITILALITSIAVVGVNRVSSSVQEKQYNNLITQIEVAASKYAFDTGQTVVFVDDLVKEGYLEGNNNSNYVINPITKGTLNCYAVNMEKVGSYYKANFIDNNKYNNENGVCNSELLLSEYNGIAINVYKNSVKVNSNNWLTGEIVLTAYSGKLNIDCNNSTCTWSNSIGEELNGNINKIVNLTNIENTIRYVFTYKVKEGVKYRYYVANTILQIDNLAPRINSVVDNNNNSVTINVTEKGSGVNEVCINKHNITTNDCEWKKVSNNSVINPNYKISESGEYYVHIRDSVGNTSHSEKVTIIYHEET